jgi:hypothetical protein
VGGFSTIMLGHRPMSKSGQTEKTSQRAYVFLGNIVRYGFALAFRSSRPILFPRLVSGGVAFTRPRR